ncbi:hypothetical protein MD484_g6745, partial [Candolleomyces efflorescens]
MQVIQARQPQEEVPSAALQRAHCLRWIRGICFDTQLASKAIRQSLGVNEDIPSLSKYINQAEDSQAVDALLRVLSSPVVDRKLTSPANGAPAVIRALAALYLLGSIFMCFLPEFVTPESRGPFKDRCYGKLIESWPHVLEWVKFLLKDANFTNRPRAVTMICARMMAGVLQDANECVYRQELVSMPRTCDVLLQLFATHCPSGHYYYDGSADRGCSIVGLLGSNIVGCAAAKEVLISRLSINRDVKHEFVAALSMRAGQLAKKHDYAGIDSMALISVIRTIHRLLAIVQELSKDPLLSSSFSRRHCATNFASALYALSESKNVEIGIRECGEMFWTEFASASVVLVSLIREVKNPSLDLARAMEAGLHRAALKCWLRLSSAKRRVLDEVILFVADFLPVTQVMRTFAVVPIKDLSGELNAVNESPDKEILHDLSLAIGSCKITYPAKTEFSFHMCSNLMHDDQSPSFDPTLPPKTCGGCSAVTYCSVACQREDWDEFHSKECALLEKKAGSSERGYFLSLRFEKLLTLDTAITGCKLGVKTCESAKRSHLAYIEACVNDLIPTLPEWEEDITRTLGPFDRPTILILDARVTFRCAMTKLAYSLESYNDKIGRHLNGDWDSRVGHLMDEARAKPNEVYLIEGAFRNGGHNAIFILCKLGAPEVVDFDETSVTLTCLLRFMHKVQYPDLSELTWTELLSLADAAEKWRVLSAMAVCNAHILSNRSLIEHHPFECLIYSLKYGYPKVGDLAAPYLIAKSFTTFEARIGHDRAAVYAWVRLKQAWLEILDRAFDTSQFYDMDELECYGVQGISDQTCCMNWPKYYKATMAELSSFRGPNSFLNRVHQLRNTDRPMTEAPCPVGTECHLPVDIILKSSDGVLIGGHKANLDTYSEGFPPATLIAPTIGLPEVVDFEEKSETLVLLLRFMHKVQFPDIAELDAEKLFALADAAEKWRVLSAMAFRPWKMREKFPLKCLLYGLKYGYPKVADLAAPYTIAERYDTVAEYIGHDRAGMHAWLRLRQSWLDILDAIFDASRPFEPPFPYGSGQGRCAKNWPLYFDATIADAVSFRGPRDFLRWVIEHKFSVYPLFSKHEGIICGSLNDGACFSPDLMEDPDDTCYCFQTGFDGWLTPVFNDVGKIPTFNCLYKQA